MQQHHIYAMYDGLKLLVPDNNNDHSSLHPHVLIRCTSSENYLMSTACTSVQDQLHVQLSFLSSTRLRMVNCHTGRQKNDYWIVVNQTTTNSNADVNIQEVLVKHNRRIQTQICTVLYYETRLYSAQDGTC